MNRNSFLKLFLTVGPFLTSPFIVMAQSLGKKRIDKGIKVNAGKDRFDKPISLFEGDTFFTKVSAKDTDGDIFVFETAREKKGGPPLHYHFKQDEFWYILEGAFLFKVSDQTFTAKAVDSVFGPRMVPHAFAKTNDGNARILMTFQPAGKMEEHFIAVSQGALSKLSEEEKDRFRQANGFKVVGPALTYDKAKQSNCTNAQQYITAITADSTMSESTRNC